MENNHDIDKLINDYKKSLPNINHTKDEEDLLFKSILFRTENLNLSKQKKQPYKKNITLLSYIKNLLDMNAVRYSIGFAGILMVIGGYFLYISNIKESNEQITSIGNQKPHQNAAEQTQPLKESSKIDTTLLASIDFDSYKRSAGTSIDKKTVFGIIGKQLQKNNIQYLTNSALTTQTINTDSGIVKLVFSYNQSIGKVSISVVSLKSDNEKNASVNISPLIQEIKNTLKVKVRMLYE